MVIKHFGITFVKVSSKRNSGRYNHVNLILMLSTLLSAQNLLNQGKLKTTIKHFDRMLKRLGCYHLVTNK